MNDPQIGDELFFVRVKYAGHYPYDGKAETVVVTKVGPVWTHLNDGALRISTTTLRGELCPIHGWNAVNKGGFRAGEIYICEEEYQHHRLMESLWQSIGWPVHAPRNITLPKVEAIKQILASGDPKVIEGTSFLDTPDLVHKGMLINGIIKNLSHFPRERAEQIMLMWFPYDELIRIWPTITGHMPMPPKPEVKK